MKMTFILGSLAAALLMVGCSSNEAGATPGAKAQNPKPTITEESLGLRKTDLYTEEGTEPPVAKFDAPAPGTSKRYERAYDNAPPLIPHSVEGLLPITKNNNACLGCHMPDVASAMGATPIPKSHFADFRPTTTLDDAGHVEKEGQVVANAGDFKMIVKDLDHLYKGRYNCSQCHVPQANIAPAVANTFKPDYQSEEMKHRSDLLDVLNEGVE